jgi:hypothetical protein
VACHIDNRPCAEPNLLQDGPSDLHVAPAASSHGYPVQADQSLLAGTRVAVCLAPDTNMLHAATAVTSCSLRFCQRVWRAPQPSCVLCAHVHRPHEVVEGPAVHDHAGGPHAALAMRFAKKLRNSCNLCNEMQRQHSATAGRQQTAVPAVQFVQHAPSWCGSVLSLNAGALALFCSCIMRAACAWR